MGQLATKLWCARISPIMTRAEMSTIDLVHGLTDPRTTLQERRTLANRFSRAFGWRPNDFIDDQGDLATANLVVEHGLNSAAVLSFLPDDRESRRLRVDEKKRLLGISYNSLVDWHVWIDRQSIECFFNRTDPPSQTYSLGFDHLDDSGLTKAVFDQAIGNAPNPNIPALDGILLETIANWRRILRSELGPAATNASLASLFNALIFARAVEDFHSKKSDRVVFPSLLEHVDHNDVNLIDAIEQTIVERTGSSISRGLFDRDSVSPFHRLSTRLSSDLVRSFYGHASVPYSYDFSVMSKHALSKIYERYVAVMQRDEPVQFSMFPTEPEEAWNKRLGGIYTPHYIASFFARYLKSELSHERFLNTTVLDPACGSGIFLRVAMEQKIWPSATNLAEAAETALNSLSGLDIDENAVSASRLSLALLYLAAHGELPEHVPIECGDSLSSFSPTARDLPTYDAVMMNPPFIRTELQSESLRKAVMEQVGFAAKGKLDTYLAFLVLSIRALNPGGFGFFVVPQPLLASPNLERLRRWISEETWVRVIADLSAIRIFDANVYVVLLVVQKKDDGLLDAPPVSLIHCQDDVGNALEDYLDGKRRTTNTYAMFDVPQIALQRTTWSVKSPAENDLLSRLDAMPKLKDVALVRQGVITGADDVFLIDLSEVPEGEEMLYKPLLPDRSIGRFTLPAESGLRIFYPFVNNVPISAAEISSEFPQTWARLESHQNELSGRSSVRNYGRPWWRPDSPRQPREVLGPKIVVPEVFLVPRFGLDIKGRWAVSHSPFVCAPPEVGDEALLLMLTAMLNSGISAWYIDSNARKFRNQYNKLSVSLLRQVPMPDLTRVPLRIRRSIIDRTKALIRNDVEFDLEAAAELDTLVMREVYGLTDDEVSLVAP